MDVVTLAVAKKYCDDSILGTAGPLRGKPCTISAIDSIEGGNRVTFQWSDNAGSTRTSIMNIMNGADGAEIAAVEIDDNGHFIFTLSDGTEIDGGEVPCVDGADKIAYENTSYPDVGTVKDALDLALLGGANLQNPITVSNPVGSATSGKVYAKGTPLETIIKDMLIKEVAPGLTLTIQPSTTLYDVVTQTVSSITMKAVVTKNTYPLSKVDFYLGTTLKHTENITAPGTYQFNVTWTIPTNSDFTLKAVVADTRAGSPMTTSKEVSVKFVAKSYYGTVDATVGEPDEAIIKSLQNNVLKDTKSLTYSGITMDYGKVVYAYPASFGNLSSIKDVPNNIQYWPGSFTKLTKQVDGISYNVYVQNDPSAAEDIQLTFS